MRRKAGEYRTKETQERTAATKARNAADKSSNATTATSRRREAARHDTKAAEAGKQAGSWQAKATGYAKEELTLQARLQKAEQAEAASDERSRSREQQQAARRAAADQAAMERRLVQTEALVSDALRQPPAPKKEPLRVLLLGAASEGDLRIGREHKRIRAAVESALHRDIDIDPRPAATTSDLLDEITKFRPHVVHFSGHSSEELILFEDELDEPHEGVIVTAATFAHAVAATDDPPRLILLNSCHSAAQIDALVEERSLPSL